MVLIGCRAQRGTITPLQQVAIQYREKIVERLVPVVMPPDSASVKALFECNEKNQVVLKELTDIRSKNVRSRYSLTNGAFRYSALTKPDTVYLRAKDSIVSRDVPIRVEVPVEVNRLTWWQKTQIYAGRICFILFFLLGAYEIIKWKITL